MIKDILKKSQLSKDDIIYLLQTRGSERTALFQESAEIKEKCVGNVVYLRGLVELSNICSKNCFYCGIRKDNHSINRYNIADEEIIESVKFAFRENYGSIVLQSGEIQSPTFTKRIENLVKEIKKHSNGKLGITLSCGEQTESTYKKWFEAGAHRYLLRIETSDNKLYKKLHPNDSSHKWRERVKCLYLLKETGYQTGSGVMIGLPFQTLEHLAEDLLFLQNFDIDMCGMGPYIEHEDTPLYRHCKALLPLEERFELAIKMVAILRIVMKDINIAATTALQTIDKAGREKAIQAGANIIMPNITPARYRDDYALYQNKPCTNENFFDCKKCLESRIRISGSEIGYGKWGDSKHYYNRKKPINEMVNL